MLDDATCALIRFDLIEAIKMWEPRVVLDKKATQVLPFPAEFRVRADMRYLLKSTGTTHDFSVAIDREKGVYRWAA